MKKLIIIEAIILLVLIFIAFMFSSIKSLDTNAKINFAIDKLLNYSIEQIKTNKTNELKIKIEEIKKDSKSVGYETPWINYINAINKNIPENAHLNLMTK
jgi:hypothetical protein